MSSPGFQRRGDGCCQRRRGTTDKRTELMAVIKEGALGYCGIRIGKQFGDHLRQPDLDQDLFVFGLRQVYVADLFARLARDFRGQLCQGVS